jgi:hypothetical protein
MGDSLANHPLILFLGSLFILWASTWTGVFFHGSPRLREKAAREDLALIEAATLTLLGLIIGFSFAMATSRYDQRKHYEAAEANAIGTEYIRADMIPPPQAARVRSLLRDYLDERVLYYTARDEIEVRQVNDRTSRLQSQLWTMMVSVAAAEPTPVVALAVSGMNDVLNSQAYAQAAQWDRIPGAAWVLMIAIAIIGAFLVGYGTQSGQALCLPLLVLPFVLSIAFLLIADIDSPRHGIIRVDAPNLESLATALPTH